MGQRSPNPFHMPRFANNWHPFVDRRRSPSCRSRPRLERPQFVSGRARSDRSRASNRLRFLSGCRQRHPLRREDAGWTSVLPDSIGLLHGATGTHKQVMPPALGDRRLGAVLADEVDELAEEVVGVVGAWAGFGVVLDGEDGQGCVADAGDGAIVEVEVGEFVVGVGGDGFGGDCEAVVLAGDFDSALQAAGLVEAAMAEFQFEGVVSGG